jgi:hypothetical protein
MNKYFIKSVTVYISGVPNFVSLALLSSIQFELLLRRYRAHLLYIIIVIMHILLPPVLIVNHINLFLIHFHAFLQFSPTFLYAVIYTCISIFCRYSLFLHPAVLMPVSVLISLHFLFKISSFQIFVPSYLNFLL